MRTKGRLICRFAILLAILLHRSYDDDDNLNDPEDAQIQSLAFSFFLSFFPVPTSAQRQRKAPAKEFPCDMVSSSAFPRSHWCKGTYWQGRNVVTVFWQPPSGLFAPGVLQTAGISFNGQIQIRLWINVYKSDL